jgi:asparagine synthase (glutamine-hydrolysing)
LYSQVSIAEYFSYTQHTLLKDTDQMSMSVGLEVREPFFDHHLIKYVLTVPDKYKSGKYPKNLLVESFAGLLPDEITLRKKQGFVFPWELWIKNDLRSFCDDKINKISQREFINEKNLKEHWQRFLKGDRSIRWAEVWLFVVLEYWFEKNGMN